MVIWINVCKCSALISYWRSLDLLIYFDIIHYVIQSKSKMFGNVEPSIEEVHHRISTTRWRTKGIFDGLSVILEIFTHGSVRVDCYIASRLICRFSVVSSGIEKVSRWTSTRKTLMVTDDQDALRSQNASSILFDYLKSLARLRSNVLSIARYTLVN